MANTLLDKGIILQSGEISKDKINLVAGAITQPFAEMVWVTTGGDMDTINRLTDIEKAKGAFPALSASAMLCICRASEGNRLICSPSIGSPNKFSCAAGASSAGCDVN